MTRTKQESDPVATDRAAGVLTHRQILVVLSGLLLGMFLAALDQTIVSTAMRTIADKLDGQTAQAWATTAYLITSTVATPLYGKLSDIYGRKPFYLFAITIFVVGSMLCGTATDIYQLAGYRAVQGIGAGGLMSLAFAIMGDMVPPRERGRYQAYFMSVFATSSVLGPVLGGLLAGQSTILGVDGWRWIFYVNVPIGIAALVVVYRVLNLPHTRLDHRIDYLGAVLLALGVVPLLVVAEQGNDWGWGSVRSIASIAGGVIALLVFVLWERRMRDEAILPLRLFQNSVFSLTSIMSFIVGMGMFGGLASLPLYFQIVRGFTPTQAGFTLLPLMVGIIAMSGISGRIMAKTGRYKVFPIIGSFLMALALVLFATLEISTPLWITMGYMVVMGAGLGLSMQMLIVAVQNAVPPREMGVATSSATFFRSMGGTFGTAVFLSILFNSVGDNIKSRFAEVGKSDPAGLASGIAGLDPAQRQTLAGAGSGSRASLDDTSFIQHLPTLLKNVFLRGFDDSIQSVFFWAALLMAPAVVLAFFVKEIPLRATGGLAARAEADAKDAKANGGSGKGASGNIENEAESEEGLAKADGTIV
jgi:EmrB/QacA subfamily drug resistance transporter